MYFPLGWPRVLKLPPCDGVTSEADLRQMVCNRDKILTAILTSNALQIWYVKVSGLASMNRYTTILTCTSRNSLS